MRIVIINETFSPRMGYMGTLLPKYLVREGLEVHVLATDLPAYHGLDEFKRGLPEFLQAQTLQAGATRVIDGYTAHIQAHGRRLGRVFMRDMYAKLRELKPDVVYCVLAIGWLPLQAALASITLGFKLFTGSHTTALTFVSRFDALTRLRIFGSRWLPGRFISLFSQKCYCPTSDCGEVAWRFFGVQRRKIEIVHLGIDPDFFFPVSTQPHAQERARLRARLGFQPTDIVCIYTGKMTETKNPALLAQAIGRLRAEGQPFCGLFVGDGVQRPAIASQPACVVLDFMEFSELGPYYRAADVAVWPTNESTSMLDAAACGVPLIVSDRIYQDHVTGNGFAYRMNDLDSLCERLRSLADAAVRQSLGAAGAKKMRDAFTWELAAKKRAADFAGALGKSA